MLPPFGMLRMLLPSWWASGHPAAHALRQRRLSHQGDGWPWPAKPPREWEIQIWCQVEMGVGWEQGGKVRGWILECIG